MPKSAKHESARDFKPGPIGWVRRRVLPLLARGSALLGVLILAGWITGRVLTDQHHWSQYLWWVPPIWAIGIAWALLVFSWVCSKLARRLGGLFLRPLLLFLSLGCSVYLVFGVWHMQRIISIEGNRPTGIRVLNWNIAGTKIQENGLWTQLLKHQPDIVLLANPRWGQDQRTILQSLAPLAPSEPESETFIASHGFRVQGLPGHFNITHRALIASRFPILKVGLVSDGAILNREKTARRSGDHGWIIFAQFDTRDDPTQTLDPLTVWFVDLPSEPSKWRAEQMQRMHNALDEWGGEIWVPNEQRWVSTQSEMKTFPEPDLIIGDFNNLRGSDSLDILAPGYSDAFSQSGYGRGRSWVPGSTNRWARQPIKLADWHIDLALTAPGVEATRYELIKPDRGPHRVQVVDFKR